ncbi:MAG: DUF58 domain-containing protein [Planctomycetaceae bacterium]|nr:DUF58 domain-containing protein [Planctomycetaceae bacterium]
MAFQRKQREFLQPEILAKLASAPLLARRPMHGNVSGRHASPHRGASVEFAEYRKYVPGDDLRRLDWRAYGRTDRHYVKEFDADTNLRLCLIVDASGSMRFGSGDVTKVDFARQAAGAIAYLASQQGDAVGLTCLGEGPPQVIPARRSPAHLSHVFDQLEQLQPAGETRLVEGLHELAETIRERALIIILSDLFADPAELRECFEHFRFRKHDLAAFHLIDPQEVKFEFHRPMRFLDMEGGTPVFAEPNEIVDRYHAAINRYLAEMKQAATETAVDYHRVNIAEDYERLLMQFLVRRTRGGGVR